MGFLKKAFRSIARAPKSTVRRSVRYGKGATGAMSNAVKNPTDMGARADAAKSMVRVSAGNNAMGIPG